MDVTVVLVRPEHDMNVGAVCRAMKNFGFTSLVIVDPRCKLGFDARMYAKHSEEVLDGAKKVKTLSEALSGCSASVGTTGVSSRFHGRIFKKCLPVTELYGKVRRLPSVAIVFGAESAGLSQSETDLCDIMATIPTAPQHTVLNLSHAVGVVLYQLFIDSSSVATGSRRSLRPGIVPVKPAQKTQLDKLEDLFLSAVDCSPTVRDKRKVATAFRRVLKRSIPTSDEASTLLCAFDSFEKAEKSRKG